MALMPIVTKTLSKPIIIAVIAISVAGGLWVHGNYHGRNVMKVKIAKANEKALQEKQKLQEKIDELTQQQTERLAIVTDERDAALERLRDRPDRMPQTSQPECQGATGAELSKPDAEFLTRLAGRADRLREALRTCYEYADQVTAE